MTVGMPGTGIGGLFYFALAFWMPFHELRQTVRGKSSWRRWRFIAFQWVMISIILVCLWGAGWAATSGVMWLQHAFSGATALEISAADRTLAMQQTKALAFASAFGASISLAVVLGFMHVLQFIVRRQNRRLAARVPPVFNQSEGVSSSIRMGPRPSLTRLATGDAISPPGTRLAAMPGAHAKREKAKR